MTAVKSGDVLEFKQDNGLILQVMIYHNTILIKARDVLTDLRTEKESSFLLRASAVNRN